MPKIINKGNRCHLVGCGITKAIIFASITAVLGVLRPTKSNNSAAGNSTKGVTTHDIRCSTG